MNPEISMVPVPGGRIRMKDDRIKKQWEVEIIPFSMSRFPVTQDLYLMVTKRLTSTFRGERLPVETVSWMEAVQFCNRLSELAGFKPYYTLARDNEVTVFNPEPGGFRLPSEAEWEYACKAGEQAPLYGKIDDIAWYRENSGGTTQPVGLKVPNRWGLYDMLGNVWEWCNDVYDEEVYGTYRIFRGGGWNDDERGCLATNRRRSHPVAFKMDDLGFRIARNK